MSRVGYGPNPSLVNQIAMAGSPQEWALAQVDIAYAASRQSPRMTADMADFNATLPTLFAHARTEREARKVVKAVKADGKPDSEAPEVRRMDFSGPRDPLHFSRLAAQQSAAWRLMAVSQSDLENPLLARMTEFWFNHFNVYVGKGAVRPFVGHYAIHVARAHALDKFEDLLLASARHPAMLLYLDQAQSVAEGARGAGGKMRGLNENYARELMELHTLGVHGGYTQTDVRELARVLTGWTVSPDDVAGFRFAARLHDDDRKVVLGQAFPRNSFATGEQEGVDAIRMLARHPSTASRVCLRLAQFFISDDPSPAVVERLRTNFLATQGDMRSVMRVLLESPEFWAPENKLFKTPLDYAASVLAATQGTAGTGDLTEPERRRLLLTLGFLNNAGQPLHGWQTPDGYKVDAATWLVPEALTRRADYALTLARQSSELEFLRPFLGAATLHAVEQERPALRAGLMLASPEFMYK